MAKAKSGKKIIKKQFSKLIAEIWRDADASIIQNGFRKAGIHPFNDNVIKSDSFDPLAFKRWQEHNNIAGHVTADANNIDDDETVSQPSTSREPNQSTSFEEILLSTLKSNMSNKDMEKKPKKRIAGGAEIITQDEVVQRLKAKEEASKPKIQRRHKQVINETTSSEDEGEDIEFQEEENGETLEDLLSQEVQSREDERIFEKPLSERTIGDWVLVKFPGKRSIKHYVGQIQEDNQIKFARKNVLFQKRSTFRFPAADDISEITDDDIIMLLPSPVIERRGEISFSISFDSFNVQ